MPQQREITVRINLATAETTLETSGYQGKECIADAILLKDAIGEEKEVVMKPESRATQTRVTSTQHVYG